MKLTYMTDYSLKVAPVPSPDDPATVIEELCQKSQAADHALELDGSTRGPSAWLDHEAELRKFSISYPTLLFELRGEGEDRGDDWVLYVADGKSCRRKARVAPFDPSDLR